MIFDPFCVSFLTQVCWKDFFPPLNCCDACWKSVEQHVWVCFWTVFSLPLIYIAVLRLSPHIFDLLFVCAPRLVRAQSPNHWTVREAPYAVLIILVLEVLKLESVSPTRLFFFKIILATWGPLHFCLNFGIN